MISQRQVEAAKNIVSEGISFLKNEYPKETKEVQKDVLQNLLVKFGMVSAVLDYAPPQTQEFYQDFKMFAALIETAWEEF